jgi:PEP-CTERM motif
MRAILVRLTLVLLCFSVGTAYADPIKISVFGGGAISDLSMNDAVSDLSISGNNISFDLAIGMSGPLFLLVKGLDARENYQVSVNMSGRSNWTGLTAEILNPLRQYGNADDPNPQPAYVPEGFSTSTDYDGYSFAQGSGLERSFLTAGGSGFAVFADEVTNARDLLRFTGSGIGTAMAIFGLTAGQNGRSFLLRLDAGNPLVTPEPGAMLLVGTGLVAIARVIKKRRRVRV